MVQFLWHKVTLNPNAITSARKQKKGFENNCTVLTWLIAVGGWMHDQMQLVKTFVINFPSTCIAKQTPAWNRGVRKISRYWLSLFMVTEYTWSLTGCAREDWERAGFRKMCKNNVGIKQILWIHILTTTLSKFDCLQTVRGKSTKWCQ